MDTEIVGWTRDPWWPRIRPPQTFDNRLDIGARSPLYIASDVLHWCWLSCGASQSQMANIECNGLAKRTTRANKVLQSTPTHFAGLQMAYPKRGRYTKYNCNIQVANRWPFHDYYYLLLELLQIGFVFTSRLICQVSCFHTLHTGCSAACLAIINNYAGRWALAGLQKMFRIYHIFRGTHKYWGTDQSKQKNEPYAGQPLGSYA